MPIAAVFFDLFNTLIDPPGICLRTASILRRQLLTFRPSAIWLLAGLPEARIAEQVGLDIRHARDNNLTTAHSSFQAMVAALAAMGGHPCRPSIAARSESVLADWHRGCRVRPGVLAALRLARRSGAHVGLISNLSSLWSGVIAQLELDREVDSITLSCHAGTCKPGQAIFEAALRKAGAPARHALMIGDSLRSDVLGAIHAGMQAIWLMRRSCIRPVRPCAPAAARRAGAAIALSDRDLYTQMERMLRVGCLAPWRT